MILVISIKQCSKIDLLNNFHFYKLHKIIFKKYCTLFNIDHHAADLLMTYLSGCYFYCSSSLPLNNVTFTLNWAVVVLSCGLNNVNRIYIIFFFLFVALNDLFSYDVNWDLLHAFIISPNSLS